MGWCVFCTWLFHTLLKLNFLHVNGLSESANRRLAQVSIIVIESSTKYAETQVLVDGFHVLTQKHRPTTAVRKSVAPHKKQPHRSFMIRKTTLGYLIYFDIAKLEHENHNQLIPLGGTTWNWWLEAFRKKKNKALPMARLRRPRIAATWWRVHCMIFLSGWVVLLQVLYLCIHVWIHVVILLFEWLMFAALFLYLFIHLVVCGL